MEQNRNKFGKFYSWLFSGKLFYFFLEIIIFLSFMAVLLSHTSLLLNTSTSYLKSIPHRLQTDAFLHGHISLSAKPFGYQHDFDWIGGHGLQQNWGLGVPLLKLPFEWVSAQLGYGPFPDKLILLFYVAFTVILLNLTLRSLMNTLGLGVSNGIQLMISWYFISWVFLSPAMGGVIQRQVDVYNETVFYSCLYAYVLICLLCIYMMNPKEWIFYGLSLLSGFAWIIRPTLIFYAAPIMLIAFIFDYQNRYNVRLIIFGVLCFCLGVGFELWANDVRFGSMLCFGTPHGIILLFRYVVHGFDGGHFFKENFLSAYKELLGDLFFNNAWQSNALRFRWDLGNGQYPFSIIHLVILVLGLFFCAFFLFFKPFKKNDLRLIYFLLALGLISFVFLFSFYCRLPYVAFRYFADFSAAINLIFLMLILGAFFYLNSYFKHRGILLLLFIFLGELFYITNEKFFEVDNQSLKRFHQESYTDKEGVKKLVAKFDREVLLRPYLPKVSYCGQSYSTEGLMYQYLGWDIHKNCFVHVTTTAILPSSKCITLNYSIQNIKEMPKIQVKRDQVFLKLVSSQMSVGNIKTPYQVQIEQIFCSNERIVDTISSYSIAWVTYEQYKNRWNNKALPIKLSSISVAEYCINPSMLNPKALSNSKLQIEE